VVIASFVVIFFEKSCDADPGRIRLVAKKW